MHNERCMSGSERGRGRPAGAIRTRRLRPTLPYLPMRRGYMYLVAIMDWHSRRVLSWRVSNTLEADFCVVALEEAIGRYGKPDIFNTDQGSQFTSLEFTGILKDNQIAIFMDGKGRWMDNVFIERLWWSLKYEYIYLNDFNGGMELKTGVGSWIDFYNFERGHSSLDDRTHQRGICRKLTDHPWACPGMVSGQEGGVMITGRFNLISAA